MWVLRRFTRKRIRTSLLVVFVIYVILIWSQQFLKEMNERVHRRLNVLRMLVEDRDIPTYNIEIQSQRPVDNKLKWSSIQSHLEEYSSSQLTSTKSYKSNNLHPEGIDSETRYLHTPMQYIYERVFGSQSQSKHSKFRSSRIHTRIIYADNRSIAYPLTIRRKYLINNPNICANSEDISVLVMVHSAIKHSNRRQNIRATYGSRTLFLPAEVRVVFLLGIPTQSHQQVSIEEENEKYRDIVQGDFLDTYHNLTHKAVMGLRWVSENCARAKFVVKADDDLVFDMWKFLSDFPKKDTRRLIWCNISKRVPIQRQGKWEVSSRELKEYESYPWSYCSGLVVIMNAGVVPRLYEVASLSPFFWIDDVYVYGILRCQARGLVMKSLPKHFGVAIFGGYCSNIYNCHLVGACVHSGHYKVIWDRMTAGSRLRIH